MFIVDKKTQEIQITRGDSGVLGVSTMIDDYTDYVFKVGDVLRFKVIKCRDCGCVVLQKDVVVDAETTEVDIELTKEETKIGNLINRPTTYWYEVELNPDTHCQTIIGYTKEEGAKVFTLLPEGGDLNDNN